jgi:plasmid stabilization system protein ParE
MRVHYRRRALFDLDEIFRYLSERGPSGAHKVLVAVDTAIKDIAHSPLGARQTSDATVHVKVVRRYLYKIFYSGGGRN